jgi:hypothetical protein
VPSSERSLGRSGDWCLLVWVPRLYHAALYVPADMGRRPRLGHEGAMSPICGLGVRAIFPNRPRARRNTQWKNWQQWPVGSCDADLEEAHFLQFFFCNKFVMELEIWRKRDETMNLICILTSFSTFLNQI